MTTFQIKVLAIIFMLIDHVGLFFLPGVSELRIVGRLAFPLFAWMIANGAKHTHNMEAYLFRLLLFAFISQVPFAAVNRLITPDFSRLNILFTLFLGLCAIAMTKRTNKLWIKTVIVILCITIAQLLHTEYGGFGVAMIVLFYRFFSNFPVMILSQTLLFCASVLLLHVSKTNTFELFGLLSLLIIAFYNGKRGVRAKYLFYIIYPLQYVVVYFILQRIL